MNDLLLDVGARAAGGAMLLRALVPFLRSPFGKGLWEKIPTSARSFVLLGLALVLGIADHLATGNALDASIFAALGAFMGAVSSHEVTQRLVPKPKPDPGPSNKDLHVLNRPDA